MLPPGETILLRQDILPKSTNYRRFAPRMQPFFREKLETSLLLTVLSSLPNVPSPSLLNCTILIDVRERKKFNAVYARSQ